jgi:hypothetical protein
MFTAVEIFDLNVLLLPVCQGLAQVHSIFVGLEDEFALDSLGHASAFFVHALCWIQLLSFHMASRWMPARVD